MKICILTLEQMNRDYSLSGGALRVYGLASVLGSMGHDVVILQKQSSYESLESVICFEMTDASNDGLLSTNINEQLSEISPDLILVEQWGLLEWFDSEVPVVVDLHGSLVWENYYKGYRDDEQTRAKLICLSRADAIIVPGERQYYYFLAWAQMAGLPQLEDRLQIVPLVLDSSFYSPIEISESSTIVMGGATWPWIKSLPEDQLKEYFRDQGMNLISRNYNPKESSISYSQKKMTETSGKAHKQIAKEYCQSLAAFDLYELNIERKLAITTRSVEYLYCGLPIIYPTGLELSQLIQKHKIGILINDPKELYNYKDIKNRLIECKQNLSKYNLNNFFLEKCQETLQTILNLPKKKNTLSPLTKIEVERRNYRKKVGELESQRINKNSKLDESFYKELWLDDMKEIYKRKIT